jgi:hypothetical protein
MSSSKWLAPRWMGTDGAPSTQAGMAVFNRVAPKSSRSLERLGTHRGPLRTHGRAAFLAVSPSGFRTLRLGS